MNCPGFKVQHNGHAYDTFVVELTWKPFAPVEVLLMNRLPALMMKSSALTISSSASSLYRQVQWHAVKTCFKVSNEPPQKCFPPVHDRLTIQGNSPFRARRPPMILESDNSSWNWSLELFFLNSDVSIGIPLMGSSEDGFSFLNEGVFSNFKGFTICNCIPLR